MTVQVYRYPMQGGGRLQPEGEGRIYPNTDQGWLSLSGDIPAGRGWSTVTLRIPPADFNELAAGMVKVNSKAALKAFASALQSYVETSED